MKKYKFTLSIGLVGGRREEIFEFEDDVTEEELEQVYEDWKNEQLNGGWEKI